MVKRQASSSTSSVKATSTKVADSACTNGPLTRSCWSNGYNVATDFDAKWPTTGKTVSVTLDLKNTTCNPDGNGDRICLLFNGVYPGPTITANWGDKLAITVKNSLPDNGTSIHWHGIRQKGTTSMDGVNGITECPIAPGDSRLYEWTATQFGTTWYHSHFSAQYGDGAVGAIVINGPASANYDLDMGPYPVSDWYYPTAFQIEEITTNNLQTAQGPPNGDTILVNGKNKHPTNGGGSYDVRTLTPGKKHLLRLINTSVDNNIRVSLDGHRFTIVTADLVPVKPITAEWILLSIGQRYEVIVNANQTAGNYWFRAQVANECASSNNFYGRSIFRYSGAAAADPTSTAFTTPATCQDEGPLVPWVPNTVPQGTFADQVQNLQVNINRQQLTTNGQNVVVWGINLTAIDIDWRKPTLQYVIDGNTSYPQVYNLIEIPTPGTWTYWIIQETEGSPVPIPHPIHLHGHDFYILGHGTGIFDKNNDVGKLQFTNPTRRDVTFLPGQGWVVIAFPADNPGAWLMHCHIAWHISEGLGVQFLESKASIPLPNQEWKDVCSTWSDYWAGPHYYEKQDSGL
ncbi:multicopper oxidase [Aulographum hederae CBS 113979]|uniref:laccase n=1 Tax=Aulographum hederae CBS 113979 TaxID=1176131 RepID=A0A6G1HFG0_9PEZI|nr:multicopper oxidase [Aulographum hederae CBS 113979]